MAIYDYTERNIEINSKQQEIGLRLKSSQKFDWPNGLKVVLNGKVNVTPCVIFKRGRKRFLGLLLKL